MAVPFTPPPPRTPITTPAPDFDRLAYWAGMAMRALLSPRLKDVPGDEYRKDRADYLRRVARESWQMAQIMMEERP